MVGVVLFVCFFFFVMIRRPPRSTQSRSSAASDVYKRQDLPAGMNEDLQLQHFSLSRDTLHLIPVLKEILALNPDIKIMGSPWSAPVWMKSNKNSVGGNLNPQHYSCLLYTSPSPRDS